MWVLWCWPIHIKYHEIPQGQNAPKYLSNCNYTVTPLMIDLKCNWNTSYLPDLSISYNSSIGPPQLPPQSPWVCDAKSTAAGPPHSPRARRCRLHGTWALDQWWYFFLLGLRIGFALTQNLLLCVCECGWNDACREIKNRMMVSLLSLIRSCLNWI